VVEGGNCSCIHTGKGKKKAWTGETDNIMQNLEKARYQKKGSGGASGRSLFLATNDKKRREQVVRLPKKDPKPQEMGGTHVVLV